MFSFFKKYYPIILSFFLLILFGFFIGDELIEKKYLTSSLIQSKTDSMVQLNLEDLRIEIPPHINLTNFYKTYGQRMLGNNQINIISREKWGANNRYADPQFIEDFCQKNYCYEDRYNPEDTFQKKNIGDPLNYQ